MWFLHNFRHEIIDLEGDNKHNTHSYCFKIRSPLSFKPDFDFTENSG